MSILRGDCVELMAELEEASVDAIVCDPPYELGFMGKIWDSTGVAYDVNVWRECLRVLKHGGHLLAFSGSRTYHRLACAVEDDRVGVRGAGGVAVGGGGRRGACCKGIDEPTA